LFKLFLLVIKGIKDNKLISRPNHTPIQELEEIEIIDPKQIIRKNKIIDKFLNI